MKKIDTKTSVRNNNSKIKHYDVQLFRRAILLQCEAAHPASLSMIVLSAGLERAGFRFKDSEMLSEAEYLAQKGYIEISNSQISAAHKRAKLSVLGMDYLESEGF